jgi:uncharacterized membrane protein YqaE (UPF0057 family)
MDSSPFGYVYLLLGCLSIIIAIFLPNAMVEKMIIRSKKVLNTEEYIKRHKILSILAGIFAIFVGFIFLKKGFRYASTFNLPLLLIVFVGCYFRDKLLLK